MFVFCFQIQGQLVRPVSLIHMFKYKILSPFCALDYFICTQGYREDPAKAICCTGPEPDFKLNEQLCLRNWLTPAFHPIQPIKTPHRGVTAESAHSPFDSPACCQGCFCLAGCNGKWSRKCKQRIGWLLIRHLNANINEIHNLLHRNNDRLRSQMC